MTARTGSSSIIIFTVLGLALIAAAFFLFSLKNKQSAPKEEIKTTQIAPPTELDISETVTWGQTCFKTPFEDKLQDVEKILSDGSKTIDTNFKDADITKIALAKKDNNLVVHLQIAGNIKADQKHNLKFFANRWLGNQFLQAYLSADFQPTTNWQLHINPSGTQPISVDPDKVEVGSDSIRAWFPLDLLTNTGTLDGIEFTLLVVDKESGATYSDSLEDGLVNSGFKCPK